MTCTPTGPSRPTPWAADMEVYSRQFTCIYVTINLLLFIPRKNNNSGSNELTLVGIISLYNYAVKF